MMIHRFFHRESSAGSTWRNLSVKHGVALPNGGSAGLMVGPFVLLDLTGQAGETDSGRRTMGKAWGNHGEIQCKWRFIAAIRWLGNSK